MTEKVFNLQAFREAIISKRMTKGQFAEKMWGSGKGHQFTRIWTGKHEPSLQTIYRIADVLEIDPVKLIVR